MSMAPGRLTMTDTVLALLWLAALVPWMLNAANPEQDLPWPYVIPLVAVAMTAGLVYGHRRDTDRLIGASLAFALTAAVVSAAGALSSPTEDSAPWGAIVVLNLVVMSSATAVAVGIGAMLGASLHHRTPRLK